MKVLIVVIQGSSQALTGISVIAGLMKSKNIDFRDVNLKILVGNVCAKEKQLQHHVFIEKLFERFQYKKTIDLSEIEDRIGNRTINEAAFRSFLKEIDVDCADAIFFSRNMQLINELVLSFVHSPLRICFGDTWVFDNNSRAYTNPWVRADFPAFDYSASCFAVEWVRGGFAGRKVDLVEVLELHNSVEACALMFSKEFELIKSRLEKFKKNVIITTSNLVESGVFGDVDEEIKFYYAAAKPHLAPGVNYIVKGHPREMNRQSNLLAIKLKAAGLEAVALAEHEFMPVEVIVKILSISEVIPILSNCAVNLKLVFKDISIKDCFYGIVSSKVVCKSIYGFRLSSYFTSIIIDRIDRQDFSVVSHDELVASVIRKVNKIFATGDLYSGLNLLESLMICDPKNNEVKSLYLEKSSRMHRMRRRIECFPDKLRNFAASRKVVKNFIEFVRWLLDVS